MPYEVSSCAVESCSGGRESRVGAEIFVVAQYVSKSQSSLSSSAQLNLLGLSEMGREDILMACS